MNVDIAGCGDTPTDEVVESPEGVGGSTGRTTDDHVPHTGSMWVSLE